MTAPELLALMTQRCDIYHRVVTTGSLGNKYRSYGAAPDIKNQRCLARPAKIGMTRGLSIAQMGEYDMNSMLLLLPGGVDVRQDDKVVMKTDTAGVALSSAIQEQQTYKVTKLMEANIITGHQSVLMDASGVLT